MGSASYKYKAKNGLEKTSQEIIDEEYKDSASNDSELFYRNEIDKFYKNFAIIFQYLKNLTYYPEFEYSGLLDLEEIDRWELILENFAKKKRELENNGSVKELREFYNDIYAIRIYDGKLLVFTSNMDKEKRVLVDVFSTAGTFKDRFYLKIPQVERPDDLHRKPMCFEKGYFWTTDMDEDDNPIVIKYKMEI